MSVLLKHSQPYGATNFESGGHYRSTFWDPMNGFDRLSLNICDTCLRRLAAEGLVLKVHRVPREPDMVWSKYDPDTALEGLFDEDA